MREVQCQLHSPSTGQQCPEQAFYSNPGAVQSCQVRRERRSFMDRCRLITWLARLHECQTCRASAQEALSKNAHPSSGMDCPHTPVGLCLWTRATFFYCTAWHLWNHSVFEPSCWLHPGCVEEKSMPPDESFLTTHTNTHSHRENLSTIMLYD